MKKTHISIIAALFFTFSQLAHSQVKEIGKFMASGVYDAEKLATAYITPWANAFGAALSGGWYNTAKVHKLGGFDLTITMNMAFIPKADKTFDLDELNLSPNVSYDDNIAPTIAGKNRVGPELVYQIQGIEVARYNTPKGSGLSFVPSPMIQAGIGLIKGTEINVRYMPPPQIGNIGSLGLWGLGLKHDVLQWIPVASKLPVLNVAIQAGYTKLNYSHDISLTPDKIGVDPADVNITDPDITWDNQQIQLGISSFTANLLVSANLPVICFYGGVGIANSKTNLKLTGYYPVPTKDGVNSVEKDPLNVSVKNNNGSPTKPRLNGGLRLKLGVITFHADYTYAYYSNLTLGLGVSFR